MKDEVTTAGSKYLADNAMRKKEDAACIKRIRPLVQIVGKTNLNEFAFGGSGQNQAYKTPINPLDSSLVPGGSSSGSAVAVATGRADLALGTDTGGSIRCPAACCGIAGLKTTFGLISLDGAFPLSPNNLDTVGPMARDVEGLVQGMRLLQSRFPSIKNLRRRSQLHAVTVGRFHPGGSLKTDPNVDAAVDGALVRARFKIVDLDALFPNLRTEWEQATADGRTVVLADAYDSDRTYLGHPGVEQTTAFLIQSGALQVSARAKAIKRRPAWQHVLSEIFKTVDFVALPTLKVRPPAKEQESVQLEDKLFKLQNTIAVNFAQNPALALPIPMKGSRIPASLQLIGPLNSEAQLLAAGFSVEDGLRRSIAP
jgi:Asp-tRNA(Asn)/Glu-tRNA(Gln) amidotransferase A subunit family amidase